jgi:hypothetical protein
MEQNNDFVELQHHELINISPIGPAFYLSRPQPSSWDAAMSGMQERKSKLTEADWHMDPLQFSPFNNPLFENTAAPEEIVKGE